MRVIDADALKAHYAWWKGGTREMTMDEAKSDFDTIVDLQPTIEAEPKHITCEFCKHLGNPNYCPDKAGQLDMADYCSWGESMDEVTE